MSDENRIAVVTGAGRGLGRELALGLAKSGYRVLACSQSKLSCTRLAAELGDKHDVQPVNVADVKAVERWAEGLLSQGLTPDLLINNAAVINRNACLWDVPIEDFQRTMRVNVEGMFHVIRSFVPAMIAAKRGVIVNFSSGWGRATSPEVAPYCASKFAVEGLSKALSQELPEGVACVAFNPGVINTDMLQSCFTDHANSFPTPAAWGKVVVPFLMKLTVKDNGKSLSAPAF